jgi:hypothetical protein
MESVTEFFKGFNAQTLIGVAVIMWYFTRHIEAKMDAQSKRTDRLYEMFIELLQGKKSKRESK